MRKENLGDDEKNLSGQINAKNSENISMLQTLKIEKFRGFKEFKLHNLGRLNLLVGTNNSGKTSILEAIQLLRSRKDLSVLASAMDARGEYLWNEQKDKTLDIRHLFYEHEVEPGQSFAIMGFTNGNSDKITGSIYLGKSDSNDRQATLFDAADSEEAWSEPAVLKFNLEWENRGDVLGWQRSLSSDGGLRWDDVRPLRFSKISKIEDGTRTQFVSSSALQSREMIELFDKIVLEPEETLVQQAIRIIEPNIERIASLGSRRYSSRSREGFVIRLSNSHQRVPIGSMGDGTWRMLGLALAAVGASGGVLLVDEIDTGLHFTAMSDMWKLIWETAKKLDIQVFATTHSSDCWSSLASIASREDAKEEGITIQRIEKGKQKAVAFSEHEIVLAAERNIEVR